MEKGRLTALFKPDGVYTRHSEGAFLRMKDGALMFAYSRFTGAWFDDAPSDIVFCVSRDEGETWAEPDVDALGRVVRREEHHEPVASAHGKRRSGRDLHRQGAAADLSRLSFAFG